MKKRLSTKLLEMYRRMHDRYGPLNWWPGETAFEIAVGAILTQNTAWRNVEKAILNLKEAGVLSARKLEQLSQVQLAMLIRPAGFFNVKEKRLRHFLAYLKKEHRLSMSSMKNYSLGKLRKQLLDVHGIGEETADSILLYACNKPTFVVDAYTRRILSRHGLISKTARYEDMRQLFMQNLPPEIDLYNDFHAQIVMIGKDHCKPKPKCDLCPLNGWEKICLEG